MKKPRKPDVTWRLYDRHFDPSQLIGLPVRLGSDSDEKVGAVTDARREGPYIVVMARIDQEIWRSLYNDGHISVSIDTDESKE